MKLSSESIDLIYELISLVKLSVLDENADEKWKRLSQLRDEVRAIETRCQKGKEVKSGDSR